MLTVERKGHRVRLRNIDHALNICLSTQNGEERVSLEPNKWVEVSDTVYSYIKGKFLNPHEYVASDWEPGGEDRPAKNKPRTESYQEYIIEFPEER